MANRRITVDIVGNASRFKAATADATKSASGMGSGLTKALAIAGGATLAVGAITAVGAAVFTTGAQMEAMDAKAKTVFGESLGTVQAWGAANAAAMGLTSREATTLAANMGDLLVPMGFTREQAAAMSTDMVGLSGALSEWSGGTRTAAEVAATLQKALLGEREELKGLGISITEADVTQQLLKDGTADLTGAALAQAKALATQTLIMEKSTDAQAAFKDGTAEGMRSQAEMGAALNEVKETLITALYPVLKTVTAWLAQNLPGAIKVVGAVFGWLGKNVIPPIATVIGAVIETIKIFIAIASTIANVLRPVFNAASAIFRGFGRLVTTVFGAIGGIVKGAINGVIDIINGVIGAINAIQVHIHVGPVNLDWNGLNIGRIPRLHAGGTVPGVPGAEVLTLLQAGETVTPRGGGGGGAKTVNITVQTGVGDPVAIGAAVLEVIRAYERSAGTDWRASLGRVV